MGQKWEGGLGREEKNGTGHVLSSILITIQGNPQWPCHLLTSSLIHASPHTFIHVSVSSLSRPSLPFLTSAHTHLEWCFGGGFQEA